MDGANIDLYIMIREGTGTFTECVELGLPKIEYLYDTFKDLFGDGLFNDEQVRHKLYNFGSIFHSMHELA